MEKQLERLVLVFGVQSVVSALANVTGDLARRAYDDLDGHGNRAARAVCANRLGADSAELTLIADRMLTADCSAIADFAGR